LFDQIELYLCPIHGDEVTAFESGQECPLCDAELEPVAFVPLEWCLELERELDLIDFDRDWCQVSVGPTAAMREALIDDVPFGETLS
jgi:hypothetical protein